MTKRRLRKRKEGVKKEEGKSKPIEAPSEKKKKRRSWPGTVAFQEIRRFQRTMGFLICKLPFV